jgi:membrane peptidoglycan carboxypeptidase
LKPRIVLKSRSSAVAKASLEPDAERSRILSSRTTSELTEMLTGVVKRGTAKGSQLEGFSAAGKTGTAQKIDPNGRYSHSRFIASFVGFAPAERPALAMVVTIDEPRGHYYGGEVAAPVFRNIAEQALRYLSISPDQELTPAQLAKRRHLQTSIPDLAHDQFEPVNAVWEGESDPSLAPQPVASPSALPMTETEAAGSFSESATIEVPDLRGRSMRAAIAELSKIGLQLGAFGSGLVVEQSPAPASKVEPGSKVMIKLSRRQ